MCILTNRSTGIVIEPKCGSKESLRRGKLSLREIEGKTETYYSQQWIEHTHAPILEPIRLVEIVDYAYAYDYDILGFLEKQDGRHHGDDH